MLANSVSIWSVALALLPFGAVGEDLGKACSVHLPEMRSRMGTVKQREPLYPKEAAERHIGGVVVTEVLFDATGRVISTVTLESPADILSAAVRRALAQWIFRADPTSDGCYFDTKITYYFLPDADEEGHIVDPLSPSAAQRYRVFRNASSKHIKEKSQMNNNTTPIAAPPNTPKTGGAAKRLLLTSAIAVMSFQAPSFVSPTTSAHACSAWICAPSSHGGRCQHPGGQGAGFQSCVSSAVPTFGFYVCSNQQHIYCPT
jgi:TonB family protein